MREKDRNENYEFLFSVIVPVYNMEAYLEEALNSIVCQSIGFSRNIQIILVNDGSTDKSEIICMNYQKLHTDNIVYLEQENRGVSAARNHGFKYARGEFINFFDADDKWSQEAFEEASGFFESHPSVDIVVAKHEFFGVKSSPHPLHYKYGIEEVVNILEITDFVQHSLSNAFVNRRIIPEDPFDCRLSISEDFALINSLLLKHVQYGLLSFATYHYRKRSEKNSAIDKSKTNKSWYMETMDYCYKHLFEMSLKMYGTIVPYIQYCVMYDLQWRIKNTAIPKILSSEELNEYVEAIKDLLKKINTEIIIAQRNLYIEEKLATLALKHNMCYEAIQNCLFVMGEQIYIKLPEEIDKQTYYLSGAGALTVQLEFFSRHDEEIVLEGHIHKILPIKKTRLVFKTTTRLYEAILKQETVKPAAMLYGEIQIPTSTFEVRMKLEEKMEIDVYISLHGRNRKTTINGKKFWGLNFENKHAYWHTRELVLSSKNKSRLIVHQQPSLTWRIKREILYEIEIWIRNKKARSILPYRRSALLHSVRKPKKEIWLISDRLVQADDNGEAFFEYVVKHKPKNVKPVFFINSDSADYQRLKGIGKTIAYGSQKYKKAFLKATMLISSAADENIINAFGENRKIVKDLFRHNFIFLQHGITKDDISDWLNRRNKNIKAFITTTQLETDSIVNNPYYGYSEQIVKCCGMSRYDKLLGSKSKTEQIILVMPTWRSSIAMSYDQFSGKRICNPNFTESQYYAFYNSLINNERLINELAKAGYKGRFVIHPALIQEADSFVGNSVFSIVKECKYSELFQLASLLVTDYSSVAFDFAILGKPVVYAQFDYESFYENHLYDQGYFDYQKDGFGPVCASLYETVDEIVRSVNNNCVLEDVYAERKKRFFNPPISDCREKTLQEILAIRVRESY